MDLLVLQAVLREKQDDFSAFMKKFCCFLSFFSVDHLVFHCRAAALFVPPVLIHKHPRRETHAAPNNTKTALCECVCR